MMMPIGWVVLVAIIAAMVGACVGFLAYTVCSVDPTPDDIKEELDQ